MTFGSTPYEGERVDFHSMSSSPSYLQWTSSKLDRTASKLRAILDDKGKLHQLVAEKRQKLPRYYPSSAAGAVAVGVSVSAMTVLSKFYNRHAHAHSALSTLGLLLLVVAHDLPERRSPPSPANFWTWKSLALFNSLHA